MKVVCGTCGLEKEASKSQIEFARKIVNDPRANTLVLSCGQGENCPNRNVIVNNLKKGVVGLGGIVSNMGNPIAAVLYVPPVSAAKQNGHID